MLDLEASNEQSCTILDKFGFKNGQDTLHIKARHKASNLQNRIPKVATVEQHVKAIEQSGITLSSLFFTIGPNSLSTDEIFQAFEHKALISKWEEGKKK